MEENFEAVSRLLFPDENEFNKTPSQRFEDELRNQYLQLQKLRWARINPQSAEQEADPNLQEIAEFIREHVKTVGKEQAVKDFQCGLNFLHKDLKKSVERRR